MTDLKKASSGVWFGNDFVAAGTVLPASHPHAKHPAFVDYIPGEPATPGAPPPPADDLDALRAEAESAGVKVDKRWGADRLREEIADAEEE